MSASNTRFIEEQVQPTMRELWNVMQKANALQNAYNSLGGEAFIKSVAGSEPVEGFVDITGDDVVNSIATLQALLALWSEGHDDNVAAVALRV